MTNLESILQSRDITLLTKVHRVKAMFFPAVKYGCESWIIKKAEHWRIDAFELWCWSPLDCKEIQPVHPKGNQFWIFIGRTDVEAETPILWPPDAKNWLIGKDPDAGKDWRREKTRTTEDEMVGWHHRLSRHEFEQTPGVGDGQGGRACCCPWGQKESGVTKSQTRLSYWTELNWIYVSMLLSPYISPSPSLSPCPLFCSLCLFLICSPVNKFFSTIFLDSAYMC